MATETLGVLCLGGATKSSEVVMSSTSSRLRLFSGGDPEDSVGVDVKSMLVFAVYRVVSFAGIAGARPGRDTTGGGPKSWNGFGRDEMESVIAASWRGSGSGLIHCLRLSRARIKRSSSSSRIFFSI